MKNNELKCLTFRVFDTDAVNADKAVIADYFAQAERIKEVMKMADCELVDEKTITRGEWLFWVEILSESRVAQLRLDGRTFTELCAWLDRHRAKKDCEDWLKDTVRALEEGAEPDGFCDDISEGRMLTIQPWMAGGQRHQR